MSRYLLLLFIILGFATFLSVKAKASNDLDKWNSEKGRVARTAMKEKLATTTYRELPNHVDSSYRSTANGGKVLQQLETSAEIKGSRVGATIDALKEVDKRSAAKKWAEKFGEGLGKDIFKHGVRLTAGGILIDEALDLMLDSIGWVIDEGGKVNRKPTANDPDPAMEPCTASNNNCSWSPTLYRDGSWAPYTYFASAYAAAKNAQKVSGWQGELTFEDGWWRISGNVFTSVSSSSNPNYLAGTSAPSSDLSVTEAEMVEKIRDYFENPQSPPSKDLLIEQAEKPKGKASIMWSDDPSSEQTIYSDNKDRVERVLNSDNPVADGLTKSTPTIKDPTEVESTTETQSNTNTSVNETTVTNPDGSTTTTGTNVSNTTNITNNNFELPAVCDYFAKLCDWLDWTKEEPELNDEKLKIEEQEITDYKYEDHVEFGSSCPFQEKIEILDLGVGVIKVKYNLDFFCEFGRSAKSTIVALGHLGALIFLMFGIRNGNG